MSAPPYLLHHLLEAAVAAGPGRPALIDGTRRMDYAAFGAASTGCARRLRAAGLQRGDRVAIVLPKSIEECWAIFGISAADGVFVPINPLLKPEQMRHIIDDAGAKIIVTNGASIDALRAMFAGRAAGPLLLDTGEASWPATASDETALDNAAIGEDLAAILYTSGSTGRPKGVMLSHRNLLAGTRIVRTYLGIEPHDRILSVLPFSFDYGLNQLLTAVEQGAVTALLTFRFGDEIVHAIREHDITGLTGYVVPLLLLDTNIEENGGGDRELTSDLYGGDERYRLAQEIVLGIGGVRMLRALGYAQIERLHMNEGHAALLAIELLRERKERGSLAWDFDGVRRDCIFTTHTPVPAGHDQFSYELVKQMLGDTTPLEVLQMLGGRDRLNMTLLALNMSTYVNGVAKRHGQVSQEMFPGYAIDSITNGIHSATWTSPSFQQLYDRHIPGWRTDSFALRHAISIPVQDIWAAHVQAKTRLLEEVRKRTSLPFRDDALTIGFARRATQYKRADLVFSESNQLIDMARTVGPIQFIFAGKAHPKDEPGKEIIRRIIHLAGQLKPEIPIAYLENYDLLLAKLLTPGVDLWLNTPLAPLEASGTSGMKAAHNGVPSLSVLDGWWVEGHIEGITGWSIGSGLSHAAVPEGNGSGDARELYDKLRRGIVPLFYQRPERWSEIMRSTIAFNASFFNTHRMVQQYAAHAYV